MRKKEPVILLFVLTLSAFLRFYHIAAIPPGLYPDEAMNGNNALETLHTGHFSVFYPDNNGREGLFINIQAISVWIFGREAWALRIISAIFGTLTIWGVYLVTKELFRTHIVIPARLAARQAKVGIRKAKNWIPDPLRSSFSEASQVGNDRKADIIALLAAFFTATSYWHLNFSRIGFRAITTPFFLSFGLYFLLRGFRRNPAGSGASSWAGSVWDMVWAGVFTGLGFQGYIAFRFVPFIIAVPILWQFARWWKAGDHADPSVDGEVSHEILRSAQDNTPYPCSPCAIILFLFITFVAALPIGWYFLKHPADFTGRSKEVSILSAPSPVLEFIKTNALTLGMFFVRGDCNDRHNYACRPELNPLVALFFLIGIIALIRNSKLSARGGSAFGGEIRNSTLMAWLFFMSLPATLTREGMPHALRSIGMIPPIMILSGLGAYMTFEFIKNRASRKTALALMILICGYIATQTYHDYFIAWAPRAQTASAFGADLWHLGQYLDKTSPNIKKYVVLDLNGNQNGGLPVLAQTVAFVTDTFRPIERNQKNFTYIFSRDAFSDIEIPDEQPVIIAPLQKNNPETIGIIREKFPQFKEIRSNDFLIFQNF